jgi:hypothetical protein
MIGHGIMAHRPNFPSLAHRIQDVDQTLSTAEQVLTEMKA